MPLKNTTGIFGKLRAGFLGVLAVIQADANDGTGLHRREQLGHFDFLGCDFRRIKNVTGQLQRRTLRLLHGMNNVSLGILITNDFHKIEFIFPRSSRRQSSARCR